MSNNYFIQFIIRFWILHISTLMLLFFFPYTQYSRNAMIYDRYVSFFFFSLLFFLAPSRNVFTVYCVLMQNVNIFILNDHLRIGFYSFFFYLWRFKSVKIIKSKTLFSELFSSFFFRWNKHFIDSRFETFRPIADCAKCSEPID